ncbi:MAG TPA: SulP family inorganic anion transporter, partial [Flavobacterium sp.]|nr:SulP family inorganic anion transporter [Flavobacterium sp.]
MTKKINLFTHLKSDFASGLVVFLIALPLCLGIAMASGAPLFAGIITGIVGGLVVGYLSQSHISVTGPAAGLTAIVLTAITDLGAFNIFLSAVFIAGVIQLLLGFIKAGSISNYFPTNVIEGMLAGIGIIIVLKQLPHAFGYDADFEGDQSFSQVDGDNTISSLFQIFNHFQLGAIIVTLVSLIILISWDKVAFLKKFKLIPGALVAVIIGIVLNEIFISTGSSLAIAKDHLVSLPVPTSIDDFKAIIVTPDFSGFTNPKVWTVGATIAVVASIETLLCIEASDRLDTQKRYTNTNVELKAQGLGNIISSLIGGLPMTSVVVRSSANCNAGAKSKMSTIIHGIMLLLSVLIIPAILNKIPLATLATILILVGYKLAKPATIKHFFEKGKYQFVPFIATMVAVVATDLLKGVMLGIAISIVF